jgi:hypothetical protein
MLGDFAKKIDAEIQMVMKRHKHEQQQKRMRVVINSANARSLHGAQAAPPSLSSRCGSGSGSTPAAAWSEHER